MKAEVRFYEKGFASAEVPEIKELREEVEVADREELVEAAKEVELPAAAEYAHVVVDGEPVIGITDNGIRDFEEDEWIVEPESMRDYIKKVHRGNGLRGHDGRRWRKSVSLPRRCGWGKHPCSRPLREER